MPKINEPEKLLSTLESHLLSKHRFGTALQKLGADITELEAQKRDIEARLAAATSSRDEAQTGYSNIESNIEQIRGEIVEAGADVGLMFRVAEARLALLIESNVLDPAAPIVMVKSGRARGRPKTLQLNAASPKSDPKKEAATPDAAGEADQAKSGKAGKSANKTADGEAQSDKVEASEAQHQVEAKGEEAATVTEAPAGPTAEAKPAESSKARAEQEPAADVATQVEEVPTAGEGQKAEQEAVEASPEAKAEPEKVAEPEKPAVTAKADEAKPAKAEPTKAEPEQAVPAKAEPDKVAEVKAADPAPPVVMPARRAAKPIITSDEGVPVEPEAAPAKVEPEKAEPAKAEPAKAEPQKQAEQDAPPVVMPAARQRPAVMVPQLEVSQTPQAPDHIVTPVITPDADSDDPMSSVLAELFPS